MTAKKSDQTSAKDSLAVTFSKLDDVLKLMEQNDIPLEDALAAFEQGVALI